MAKKKSYQEFIESFKERQPDLFKKIKVIGEYSCQDAKIDVKCFHGICSVKARNLLEGKYPSIKSSYDKEHYLKKELENRNIDISNLYSVVKYINSESVILKDEYGLIKQSVERIYKRYKGSNQLALNKHEYFMEKLKKTQPKILENIKILTKYNSGKEHILVEDEFGILSTTPNLLLRGILPTSKSALDINDYILKMMERKRPDIYYNFEFKTKIKSMDSKIIIKDKYGYMRIQVSQYIHSNQYPTIQSAICKTQYALNQFLEKHGRKYDYKNYVYKNSEDKVFAVCRYCGNKIDSTYKTHVKGRGCKKCALLYSSYSRSGFIKKSKGRVCTCYIINCHKKDENFYKIGITSLSVGKRFESNNSMPYEYNIVKEIKGNAGWIWDIEKELHRHNRKNQYKYPKIYFAGREECFTNYDLNIKELENYIFE